jgi:hypothetical protein
VALGVAGAWAAGPGGGLESGFGVTAGFAASGLASAFGSGRFVAGAAGGVACGFAAAGARVEVPASLRGGAFAAGCLAGAAFGADLARAGFFASGAGRAVAFVLAGGVAAGFLCGAGTGAAALAVRTCFVAGLALAGAALRRADATCFACAAGRADLAVPLAEVLRLLDPLARTGAFIPDDSPAAAAACGLTSGTSPAGHSQDIAAAWASSGSPRGLPNSPGDIWCRREPPASIRQPRHRVETIAFPADGVITPGMSLPHGPDRNPGPGRFAGIRACRGWS